MPNQYEKACCDKPVRPASDLMTSAGCSCNIAIANVPWQYYKNTYEPMRAIKAGTIFPELDKPFTGRRTCP